MLYLDDQAILQMIRYFAMAYPSKIQEALKIVNESNIWQRRNYLDERLKYDFYWFVDKFKLTDQIGQKIL